MTFLKKYKTGLIILLVCLAALFFYLRASESTTESATASLENEFEFAEKESEDHKQPEENISTTIVVDLKGAVSKPGVYEMETGERIYQVIDKAGGLLKEADEKKINLATQLVDGMVVYVPLKGEEGELAGGNLMGNGAGENTVSSSNGEAKVNINQADLNELQTITGIGPAKAEAILTYREENGNFKKVEDLLNVTGIGEKSLERIKDSIVVQ
ncbi:helix-hairpin-helix domain-containing protein [Metabacillus arenae]|uniref:Helix-hairpin-helix domain-containing protein n=1 Tax=Metabacillus arenae TaxID=2771434 RepID=A0A926NQA3_9BACI|nr:helix-hairpin-helix domain-containing protein [Metabacillus arenae]MBD1382077.1 helix-hairpin-helix domain-containing protein [Metabacillus arenae]